MLFRGPHGSVPEFAGIQGDNQQSALSLWKGR